MIKEIEKVLHSGYKENIVFTGNTFELIETDPNAMCKRAKFRKGNGDVIAYKFDKSIGITNFSGNIKTIDFAFPFFTDIKGLKAMADFLIFYQKEDGNLYAIICNLKSGNNSNSNNQFYHAEIFMDFIIKNVKRQFDLDIEIGFYRKVLFSTKQLYKFNRSDWNDQDKAHIPINFQCTSTSICPLDAVCN